MKRLLSKVISMVLVLTMIASMGITTFAMEYPDEGYWANEAIEAAKAVGLLYGKDSSGYMDSEAYLTRAEMAAIMVRAFGASVKADVSGYADLNPSAWYYNEFAKAVQMRVFEGDGSGYMYPNDNITREEVFTVVARAMVLSDSDHSELNKFGDAGEISSWAMDYMSIMAQKSYVNGDEAGNVNPKKYITRAEFAQLMYNIFKTYYLTSGSYSDTVDTACVMINTENVNLTNVVVKGDLIIGDGANESTIKLTNVTVEGRLLVRGSARIELVNTTVGEVVVVNNYNSVVHFDNYKTESVFNGIVENTKATFKQRSGGGSSSSSNKYVTVTFYDSGEVVDTVVVEKGSSVPESEFPASKSAPSGYVKNGSVSSLYENVNYTHTVNYGWWYNPTDEKWEQFIPSTKDDEGNTVEGTIVNKDTDVSLLVNKFILQTNLSKVTVSAYYEPETRFADTIKDIIYGKTPLDALNAGYWDKIKQRGKDYNLIDDSDNILMQKVMVKFSQILGGEEKTREFIIDSAKDSFGVNDALTAAFVRYAEDAAAAGGESSTEIHALMKKAINYMLDKNPECVEALQTLCETILSNEEAFCDIVGCTSAVYEQLSDTEKEIAIAGVKDKIENGTLEEREEIVDKAIDYLLKPAHISELEKLADYTMTYLKSHKDEPVVDKIIEECYGQKIDKLVDELCNENQFTITEDINFVAEGLIYKLKNEYSYESYVKPQIPEKVLKVYPEEKIEKIYNDAVKVVLAQAEDAVDVAINEEAKIDSGLTAIINPVDNLYAPLYERFVELLSEKVGTNYYYKDNDYLQELIKLYKPENLFAVSLNADSGYAMRTLEEYYDLLYKATVLGDDALIWYHDNLEEGEIDRLTDDYQDLVLKYVNIIADVLDAYAKDGTLPNEKLSPFEKAFKEKFPELVADLVDWYKNSDLNKDYTGEDYQKVQDTISNIIKKVNLTTDEFFDEVLNSKSLEDVEQLEKINDDNYKVSAKDYILEIFRKVTEG